MSLAFTPSNPLPVVPVAPRFAYPHDVCDACQEAAKVEIDWRLQPWHGRMRHPGDKHQIETQVKLTLQRYRDVLSNYYWAVVTEPWLFGLDAGSDIIVYLVAELNEDLLKRHPGLGSQFRTVASIDLF